jgi:hypothetical protein
VLQDTPFLLVWIYIVKSALPIVHEVDSAYWQEWKLFKLPGGLTLFLCLHVPLIIVVLYGLLLISEGALAGLIISLIVALAGIAAFVLHMLFIRRGHQEFKAPVSIVILALTLAASLVQLVTTISVIVEK